jgi:hypothetical protein
VSFDFSQDALEIEALAKRRLADEYDAAQERGEVSSQRRHPSHVPDENMRAASADLGLTRKDIYEARQIRDAEERCQAFFGLPFPAKAGAGVKPVACQSSAGFWGIRSLRPLTVMHISTPTKCGARSKQSALQYQQLWRDERQTLCIWVTRDGEPFA